MSDYTLRWQAERIEELEEELAEVKAELRRQSHHGHEDIKADLRRRLRISPSQASVLHALIAARGKSVRREMLLRALPNPTSVECSGKLLEVVILHLRRRLGYDAIETDWGNGYAMTVEGMARVEDAEAPPANAKRLQMKWTEEQADEVRRRWRNGQSDVEIATAMGVSAHSVISKRHRLGLFRTERTGERARPSEPLVAEGQ